MLKTWLRLHMNKQTQNYAKCPFSVHESNYNKSTIADLIMNHWKKTCTWASIDIFKLQISILEYGNQNGIHLKCADYATDDLIIQTLQTFNYNS